MYYVYVVHTGSVAISYDVLLVNAKIKKIYDHIRGSGAISYGVYILQGKCTIWQHCQCVQLSSGGT